MIDPPQERVQVLVKRIIDQSNSRLPKLKTEGLRRKKKNYIFH